VNRVGPGDALIGLALVTLVLAALLPVYRARAFETMVDDATTDVDTLRGAMVRAREAGSGWPATTPPGRVPSGAFSAFGGDTTMVRDEYVLQWRLWDRIERVPAPPRPPSPEAIDPDEAPPPEPAAGDAPPDTVGPELMEVVRTQGAVVVHSAHERLLAQLLRRYGEDVSFVRDTTWTLVITATGEASPNP